MTKCTDLENQCWPMVKICPEIINFLFFWPELIKNYPENKFCPTLRNFYPEKKVTQPIKSSQRQVLGVCISMVDLYRKKRVLLCKPKFFNFGAFWGNCLQTIGFGWRILNPSLMPREVDSLAVAHPGVLRQGGLSRGVSAQGVSAHGGVHLPPTEFLTHACENITFPQLRFRTVISDMRDNVQTTVFVRVFFAFAFAFSSCGWTLNGRQWDMVAGQGSGTMWPE